MFIEIPKCNLRIYLSEQFATLETIACVVVPDFGADNTITLEFQYFLRWLNLVGDVCPFVLTPVYIWPH